MTDHAHFAGMTSSRRHGASRQPLITTVIPAKAGIQTPTAAGIQLAIRLLSNYLMHRIFQALDDPTRRRILELLKKQDLSAGEIASEFEISKPSISHHLDILKQAGLVIAIRRGQFQVYSLNLSVMDEAVAWLLDLNKKKKKA
jgi:ArsR family transcriptional regulator, arsenate/arsenite/antimonite-responsive transcriptional repressor